MATKIAIPKRAAVADTPVYIGVDDGHFGTKICLEDGTCHYMPSRAVIGLSQVVHLDDSDHDNGYEADGEKYTVIEDQALITAEDTRHLKPIYPVHPINRAIVHHMLQKHGFGGRSVIIATGLPLDNYYTGSKKNDELIDAKVKNLLAANIRNLNPNVPLAKILKHHVMSEAIAAWIDLAIDFSGNEIPETTAMVEDRALGIVDIGGKTTDIALITEGGSSLYPDRSGTRGIGALNFYEAVGMRLKERFTLLNQPPNKHIEQAIRTKRYTLFGDVHEVADIIDEEAQRIASQIKSMMNALIRGGDDIGRVVFVGGGSILLRDYLAAEYPKQAIFPPNPEFANARGLLKAAKFLYADAE